MSCEKLPTAGASILVRALLAILVLSSMAGKVAAMEATTVLAKVGDESITVADVDSLLAHSHGSVDLQKLAERGQLVRILDKEIRDRLILTDAMSVGFDQEEEVLAPVLRERDQRAARLFLREHLPQKITVAPDSVQAYFDLYYRSVTLRQVSVRRAGEADSVRTAILNGAAMDSLAQVRSLDPLAVRGGLVSARDWGDLEVPLRQAVTGLQPGELAAPFPDREVWTVVRLEGISPADPARLDSVRPTIESRLKNLKRRKLVKAVVDSLVREKPISRSQTILDGIRSQADEVLRGSFRRSSDEPVLWIDDEQFVTEKELRTVVAQAAMGDAKAPFDSLFAQSVRQGASDLALRAAAQRGGLTDRPMITRRFESDLRKAVITAYLKEFVADKITFRREEITEFYDEHAEDLRGPDEVQMSVLIYDAEEEADDVYRKLEAGDDFDYLREKTQPGWKASSAQSQKWAPISSFSDDVRSSLEELAVGEHSPILTLGDHGWMIFRLDGRRPGSLPRPEEVEMPIREQLYREHFNSILDDVLAQLTEVIGVTRYEDQIQEYFQPTP